MKRGKTVKEVNYEILLASMSFYLLYVKSYTIFFQLPEMRDNILQVNEGRWKKIAKKQSKTVFNPSESDMRAQAKR